MLKENGPPPQGEWAEFAVLEPVRDLPSRHAATLLTFDAVAEALGKIEAQRRPADGGRRDRSMNAIGQAPRQAAHLLIRFYQLTLFGPAGPPLPLPADLLGLRRRSDPAARPVGGRLDGDGANLPLPSLGRLAATIRRRKRAPSGASWLTPWRYGRWRYRCD